MLTTKLEIYNYQICRYFTFVCSTTYTMAYITTYASIITLKLWTLSRVYVRREMPIRIHVYRLERCPLSTFNVILGFRRHLHLKERRSHAKLLRSVYVFFLEYFVVKKMSYSFARIVNLALYDILFISNVVLDVYCFQY